MPEQVLPIAWPKLGLVEGFSFSDQPELSARELQNCRYQDCVTGRLLGGQRAGLSKYLTSALKISGTKAVGLLSFFVDNRQVTYTAASSGSETEIWDEPTPGGGNCRNIKIDRQGNRYALSGNSGIVKFSADGEQLWQLAVPVADTNHIIRALAVTSEDLVIVGVSEGGDQKTAKLFAYEQLPDNKTEKLWEITPGAYIEDVVVSQDKLYTCQNRPDRKKSHVRIYEFIESANPELAKQWRCPHPVNSIAVKKDGSVLVACEPAGPLSGLYWRDPDPLYPDSNPDSVDWTPDRLSNADRRIWSWYKADEIDQSDAVTDLTEGVELFRWRDTSKNNRHLYAPYDDGSNDTGPALCQECWLEHKGLRFTQPHANNINPYNPPFQALRSFPNASTSKTFADQQRTMLPAYADSAWAIYLAIRPSATEAMSNATLRPRWVFGQSRDNAASTSKDHILFVNATSTNGNTLAPNTLSGGVFWFEGVATSSGGDGTGGQILQGRFDIRNNNGANADATTTNRGFVTIVGMVCDGNVNLSGGGDAKSLFSINGNPIDTFVAPSQETLRETYLGIYRATKGGDTNPTVNVEGFMGDILEILVLDRQNRNVAPTAFGSNVVSFDDLQASSLAASQTFTEHVAITGYFAHKYGAQEALPFSNAAVNNYPHPFGITGSGQDRVSGPPNQAGTGVNSAQALANKRFACVVKYNAEGQIKWTANEMETVSGNRTGGFGYAVAVNSEGNIYSVGPAPTGTGADDDAQVRMIVDTGDDFSLAVADGAWSATYPSNFNQTYKYPRIDVDEFDNLYVPFPANGGLIAGFRVYQSNGTLLHSGTTGAETSSFCVAADRRIPDYRSDISPKRAETITVGTNQAEIDLPNVHTIRLVNSAQASGAVRTLHSMGVSGGDIVRFTTSGVTTPTGGSGALDSSAKYVQGTTLYKKGYWTDGRQLKQYDPISNTVSTYKCLSAGAIPSRCALIESWRGRIVLARSADEPHNWFMSKKDEPTNWDYFPPVPSEIDAVAGNNSAAGLCPDIINSVVPYSEDILVFGGDHSIWMLVGDPAAGGRLELVSDITGMAFGRPWCKDPNGILYFVGSRGGLFRWGPGSRPERVSIRRIERQLQGIDFTSYHVKLAWNYQDEGVHILQCPFGAGGTNVSHWFYEKGTQEDPVDAFAKDIFGTSAATNVQPTDVHVLDGDDFDDRVLIFGCEDGFIRKWDSDARSDDTRTDGSTKIAIDSFVTIFPIQAGEQLTGMETQFHGLTVVLGDRGSGVRFELFASDEPDALGISQASGVFGPGRNPPSWERIVGPYCGLRLRNAAVDERWSFERAYLYAAQAGMARPRTRN